MSIETLLLASVLTTCAGQALYALIALKNGWYSTPTRWAVAVLCATSSVGGLRFILAGLTGGETLLPALVFAGCQALAVTLVVGSGLRGIVRGGNLAEDRIATKMDRVEQTQARQERKQDRDLKVSDRNLETTERLEAKLDTAQGDRDQVKDDLGTEQSKVRDALGEEQDTVREKKEERERQQDSRRDE